MPFSHPDMSRSGSPMGFRFGHVVGATALKIKLMVILARLAPMQ